MTIQEQTGTSRMDAATEQGRKGQQGTGQEIPAEKNFLFGMLRRRLRFGQQQETGQGGGRGQGRGRGRGKGCGRGGGGAAGNCRRGR